MASFAGLLALCAVLTAVAGHPASGPCHEECAFRFCKKQGPLSLSRPAGAAFSAGICRKGGAGEGVVAKTGEARVMVGEAEVAVSEWEPEGLRHKFTPTFFKALPPLPPARYSTLTHEPLQGDQLRYVQGRCFSLPVLRYKALALDGKPVPAASLAPPYKPKRDCIAFRTQGVPHYLARGDEEQEDDDDDEKGKKEDAENEYGIKTNRQIEEEDKKDAMMGIKRNGEVEIEDEDDVGLRGALY